MKQKVPCIVFEDHNQFHFQYSSDIAISVYVFCFYVLMACCSLSSHIFKLHFCAHSFVFGGGHFEDHFICDYGKLLLDIFFVVPERNGLHVF